MKARLNFADPPRSQKNAPLLSIESFAAAVIAVAIGFFVLAMF